MASRTDIESAIRTYCRVQSDKDRNGWAALFADDVFHEDPVGLRQTQGKQHVIGPFWDSIVSNDVRIWLTDAIIVRGNEALAIMACELGPLNHRRRLAPVIDQFRFNDEGLICSVRGFYNLD